MVDLLLMAMRIITRNSLGGPEGDSVGGNACYTNLATPGTLTGAGDKN